MRVSTLLAIALLSSRALALNVEARCDALGSQCVCSETLDANDDLAANPDPTWDPSNSVSKPCGDTCTLIAQCDDTVYMNDTTYQELSRTVLASSVKPFPTGNPYVYEGGLFVSSGAGVQFIAPDTFQDVQNETVCTRVYRYFDSETPDTLPHGDDRIKLDGHHIYAASGDPNRAVLAYTSTQWAFGNIAPSGGAYVQWVMDVGPYSIPDPTEGQYAGYAVKSQAGWVRQEMCTDVGSGTLHMRSRMNFLSDGTEITRTSDTVTGGPPLVDVVSGSSMMTEGPTLIAAPDSARQYMSHYMQARVPLDTGFWIGAAAELEGGLVDPLDPPYDAVVDCPTPP